MKYIILVLLFNLGCVSTKQVVKEENLSGIDTEKRLWFKTYVDEIGYYAYISPDSIEFKFTHEEMKKIGESKMYDDFFDTWILTSIVFKDIDSLKKD